MALLSVQQIWHQRTMLICKWKNSTTLNSVAPSTTQETGLQLFNVCRTSQVIRHMKATCQNVFHWNIHSGFRWRRAWQIQSSTVRWISLTVVCITWIWQNTLTVGQYRNTQETLRTTRSHGCHLSSSFYVSTDLWCPKRLESMQRRVLYIISHSHEYDFCYELQTAVCFIRHWKTYISGEKCWRHVVKTHVYGLNVFVAERATSWSNMRTWRVNRLENVNVNLA